jgi:hypothetical protein
MDDLFLEFIDGLDRYFENDSSETAYDMTLWIDLFCFNYFEILHYEDPCLIRSWLCKLEHMFHRYGNTLVILAPWDSRNIFESPFCLFQLSIALQEGFLVDFSISRYEEDRFTRQFLREYHHHGGQHPQQQYTTSSSTRNKSTTTTTIEAVDAIIASSSFIQNFAGQSLNFQNYSQEGIHFPMEGLQLLSKEFLVVGDVNNKKKAEGEFRSALKLALEKWLGDLALSWLNNSNSFSSSSTHHNNNNHSQHEHRNPFSSSQVMEEYHQEYIDYFHRYGNDHNMIEDRDCGFEDQVSLHVVPGSPTNHASLSRALSVENPSATTKVHTTPSPSRATQQGMINNSHNTNNATKHFCFRGWKEEEKCYFKVIDRIQYEKDCLSKDLEDTLTTTTKSTTTTTRCSSMKKGTYEESKLDTNRIYDNCRISNICSQLMETCSQLCAYHHELYLLYLHHHHFVEAEAILLQTLELQQRQQSWINSCAAACCEMMHPNKTKEECKVSDSQSEFNSTKQNELLMKHEEAIMTTILKLAKLCVVQKKIQMAELFYQSYLNKAYGCDVLLNDIDKEQAHSHARSRSQHEQSPLIVGRTPIKRNTKEFILILQNIANFYYSQASFVKAMQLFQDCYQLSLDVHGHEHLTTLHCASMLANTYVHLELEDKAIEMARDCVVIATAVHGYGSVHVSQYETNYIRIVENKLVKRVEEEVSLTRRSVVAAYDTDDDPSIHEEGNSIRRSCIRPAPIDTNPSAGSNSSSGRRNMVCHVQDDVDEDAVSFSSHRSHKSHHSSNSNGYYSTTNLHPTFETAGFGNGLHSSTSQARIETNNGVSSATTVCVIC